MRVSKLLWVLSLVVLVLTFYVGMPGKAYGIDPWDEGLQNSGGGISSDGESNDSGNLDDPSGATDDPGTITGDLTGTPLFWLELLIGGDATGTSITTPTTTSTTAVPGTAITSGLGK